MITDYLKQIRDVFSVRNAARGLGYKPDTISERLRSRILMLYVDVLTGRMDRFNAFHENHLAEFWTQMHQDMRHLYGRPQLSQRQVHNLTEDVAAFLERCTAPEFFDFIELSFKVPIAWMNFAKRSKITGRVTLKTAWRSAVAPLKARSRSSVARTNLPVRFDDTEIPGLPQTVGYLQFQDHGVDGVCRLLLEKLNVPAPVASTTAPEALILADPPEYQTQRNQLPTTTIFHKIITKPRWRVSIRPSEFKSARFRNLEQCEYFMKSQSVRSNSKVPYPFVPYCDISEKSNDWIAEETEGPMNWSAGTCLSTLTLRVPLLPKTSRRASANWHWMS